MKKILAILVFSASVLSAQAGPYNHHHHHHGGHGSNWVAPLVIGGVIGYAVSRTNEPPVVVQQPPVIVQQPQDVVYLNGIAYRKQLILVNGVYQEVLVRQ